MRRIELEPLFRHDVRLQAEYYEDREDRALADRFVATLEQSVEDIARTPDIGKILKTRIPVLRGIRSFAVHCPFDRLLMFYRYSDDVVIFVRMLHGARNIQRRLLDGKVDQP